VVKNAADAHRRDLQLAVRFSVGWDPYEVWCKRIRAAQGAAIVRVLAPPDAVYPVITPLRVATPEVSASQKRSAMMLIWPALMLVVALGLNRALVGMFGVDLVTVLFGEMTPAARAISLLLGSAAIYCAFRIAMFAKHPRSDSTVPSE
jgi:uncharacterized membrane protein YuzA (DUF378 family)